MQPRRLVKHKTNSIDSAGRSSGIDGYDIYCELCGAASRCCCWTASCVLLSVCYHMMLLVLFVFARRSFRNCTVQWCKKAFDLFFLYIFRYIFLRYSDIYHTEITPLNTCKLHIFIHNFSSCVIIPVKLEAFFCILSELQSLLSPSLFSFMAKCAEESLMTTSKQPLSHF